MILALAIAGGLFGKAAPTPVHPVTSIVRAVQTAPPAPPPTIADTTHAIRVGRLDQARIMIAALVASGVKGPQLDRLIADLAFASGQFVEAKARYQQLLAASPNDTYLCERAGIAALQLDDIAAASPLILCATAASNASWSAWNARGVLADRKGDWAAADDAFQHASALAPNEAKVLNNRGWSELMRGNWKEAEPLFEQAIAADPAMSRAANNLELARAALAQDLPQRLPGESERDWAARLNDAGVISAMLGDRKKAVAAFTQALETSGTWYDRAANNLKAAESGR